MEAEIDQDITERKRGRPRVISDVVAMRICDLLANGRSLRKIASMPGMPARSTIQREIAKNPDFSGQYRRARATAGDFWADRVIEIAEDVLNGKKEPNAARVAISSLQWAASKLNPAEYGDHQRVDIAVTHDATEHAPDWIKARLARSPVIDMDAEVIAPDTAPEPTSPSSSLVANIAAAADAEVTPKPQPDQKVTKGDI